MIITDLDSKDYGMNDNDFRNKVIEDIGTFFTYYTGEGRLVLLAKTLYQSMNTELSTTGFNTAFKDKTDADAMTVNDKVRDIILDIIENNTKIPTMLK